MANAYEYYSNKSKEALQRSIDAATAGANQPRTNPRVESLLNEARQHLQNSVDAATGKYREAQQAAQNNNTNRIVSNRTAAPASTNTGIAPTAAAQAAAETPTAEAANTATEAATPAATANAATNTSAATTGYVPTGIYDPANLEAYNQKREGDIRALYEEAQNNTLAGLKTAYDQNLSDRQAELERISPQYRQSANALSAEYERQRRNNNMQAAANGLNTGAGSQMQLAQSANYQANQAGLAAKENEALNEANRAITDLKTSYQNAIQQATANNNYKLAAAMLDEYENAYNRQMQIDNTNYTRAWNEDERNYTRGQNEAANLAQYGDFSGYRSMYGDDVANLMEQAWSMKNPYAAWAMGRISAEDFYALTGKLPSNPNDVANRLPGGGGTYQGLTEDATSGGSGYSGGGYGYIGGSNQYSGLDPRMGAAALQQNNTSTRRSYSSGGGGGYSSSRDKAYRGEPGHYDNQGNFVADSDGHVIDYSPQVKEQYNNTSSAPAATVDTGNNWTREENNDSNGNVLLNWWNNLTGKG